MLIAQAQPWLFPDIDPSASGQQKRTELTECLAPFCARIHELVDRAWRVTDKEVIRWREDAFAHLAAWTNEHKNQRQTTLFRPFIEFAMRLMEHATRLAATLAAFEGELEIARRHIEAATALMDFYIGQRMTLEVALAHDPRDDWLVLVDNVARWLDGQPAGTDWTNRDFARLGPYCLRNIGNDKRAKVLDELVVRAKLEVVHVAPTAKGGRPTTKWFKP